MMPGFPARISQVFEGTDERDVLEREQEHTEDFCTHQMAVGGEDGVLLNKRGLINLNNLKVEAN